MEDDSTEKLKEVEAHLEQVFQQVDDEHRKSLEPLFPAGTKVRAWTDADANSLQSEYDRLIQTFQDEKGKASGWISQEFQDQYLEDLISIAPLQDQSILDLGCGSGALLGLLKRKRVTPSEYIGVDISNDALEKAKAEYPDQSFLKCDCYDFDALKDGLAGKKFDYVIASGLFGVRPRSWSEDEYSAFALDRIEKILSLAKKGFAFNMIPWVYPQFLEILDQTIVWKDAENENISIHKFDRLRLQKALSDKNIRFQLAGFDLIRVFSQYPIFLYQG